MKPIRSSHFMTKQKVSEVKSLVTHTAKATEDTGASARKVLGAAEQLGTQSNDLRAAVSSFQYRVKSA